MDQIKRFLRNLSLRKSIILYVVVFALIAVMLSCVTAVLCNHAVSGIYEKYPAGGARYYLTTETGERLGAGEVIGPGIRTFTAEDERLVSILELLPGFLTPIYSALCVLGAAMLFYRNKLQKPLVELTAASGNISESDLDFTINYDSKDELGQLCTSFEAMRSTLAANFSEMWRQIEDRKRLNAAFAHDLRTPLTVLKGYNEMLQAGADPQTRETAATMGKHIARVEHYIDSMNGLQRLEDLRPDCRLTLLRELSEALHDSAELSCKAHGKTLCFRDDTISKELRIDKNCILEVGNNLIGNAVRYAAGTVTCSIREQSGGLLLAVSDDGPGFSDKGLHDATAPYFTEADSDSEHYGLGLYICRLLCAHHGGYLRLENTAAGARITAYFKRG